MMQFGRHICAAQNDKEKKPVISTKCGVAARMEKSVNQVS